MPRNLYLQICLCINTTDGIYAPAHSTLVL